MRTTNLDTLLSDLDILPNYVDDPSRSMRLSLAFLTVLLLLMMFLLPSASKINGSLFSLSSSPAPTAAPAPAKSGTGPADLS